MAPDRAPVTATVLTRRQTLGLVGLGAAVTATAGVVGWRLVDSATARGGAPFTEPDVLTSAGGVLTVTLEAAVGAPLAGRSTRALGYNGRSPGPTLRVRPGDVLRVSLHNRLDDPTNLHTHGLHVSPQGIADNVFRTVASGEDGGYEFALPDDHPLGTFWYHPHLHGRVADQVFGGLVGAIVVTGPDEPQVDRDRVLVVSDVTLTVDGRVAGAGPMERMLGREGELVLVNGDLRPVVDLTAGSTERWRVVNACVSRFLALRLDGLTWGLLGYDGQALHDPVDRDTLLLAPGNRVDVLVRPERSGTTALRDLGYDRGGMGMMGGGSRGAAGVLASVDVGSGGSSSAAAPTWRGRVAPDLRGAVVDRRRVVTMTGGMGMGRGGMGDFGFDGLLFDADRVDQRLRLGTVEEWRIVNRTTMDHPFHLHVWPMQVVGGPDPGEGPQWRDVVNVPARGEVVVRVAVRDHPGRTVYHCHVLDHEDLGMMATVLAS